MPIAYRAGATAQGISSATVTKPGSVVDGDVLYAFVNSDGTVNTPSGWTFLKGGTIAVLRRVASSEPASWAFTSASASYTAATVDAYSGVDNVTPEDVAVPNGTSGTVATITWPSITPVTNSAWVIAFVADVIALTSTAVPAGYTQRELYVPITGSNVVSDKLVSPAALQQPTATDAAGSPSWTAYIVAIRPTVYARPKRSIAQVRRRIAPTRFGGFR